MSIFGTPVESRALSHQDVFGKDLPPSNRKYSPRAAMSLSTVIGCVLLRSNLLSQLPIDAVTKAADGRKVTMPVQPKLVLSPSALVTRSTWLRQYSISLDLWGFAAGRKLAFDAAGYPTVIEWLPPDAVEVREDHPLARPRYFYEGQELPEGEVLYVPSMPMPGTTKGICPLELTGLVELSQLAQDFGRDWFRKGAVPSSILYSDEVLTEAEAEGILARVVRAWRGRRPAILGAGLKYEQVSVAANESQFLETLQDTRVQICNAFLVAPEELGIAPSGSSVTYANREQRSMSTLTNMLNPALIVLEEAISAQLRALEFASIDTTGLLKSDLSTRVSTGVAATGAGLLEVDEWRRFENLPPLDGKAVSKTESDEARAIVEAVQKVYLGVDTVISAEEARAILERLGAELEPTFAPTPAKPPIERGV